MENLRIWFRDESLPEINFTLTDDDGSGLYSLGVERIVKLPNGENLEVYAETSLKEGIEDISISIIENERDLDIRCSKGVIVSYETISNIEVLFQIGTGAWE